MNSIALAKSLGENILPITRVDTRGAEVVVLSGFTVVGRYPDQRAAELAAIYRDLDLEHDGARLTNAPLMHDVTL